MITINLDPIEQARLINALELDLGLATGSFKDEHTDDEINDINEEVTQLNELITKIRNAK